jgi:TorA maturation chaperone TorD
MEFSREIRTDTASARGQVYGLLASVFRSEPDKEFLQELKGPRFAGAFASLEADFGKDFRQSTEEELRENLAIEFTRLFMGPGEHISPHESIFGIFHRTNRYLSTSTVTVEACTAPKRSK